MTVTVILDKWRCVVLWPWLMDKWYYVGPLHVTAEDAAEEARKVLLGLQVPAHEVTSLLGDLQSGDIVTLEMGVKLRVLEVFPGFRRDDVPEGVEAQRLMDAYDAWIKAGNKPNIPWDVVWD